jgi:hypothetical protein
MIATGVLHASGSGLDRSAARAAFGLSSRSTQFARVSVPHGPLLTFPQAPSFIPDGRVSRVRLATRTFPPRSSLAPPKLKRWLAYTPTMPVCRKARHPTNTACLGLCVPMRVLEMPVLCREPLCPVEALPLQEWPPVWAASEGVTPLSSLLRTHAPDHLPPAAFGFRLGSRVFAGCCQPLLKNGPSRRYLRNPCIGA